MHKVGKYQQVKIGKREKYVFFPPLVFPDAAPAVVPHTVVNDLPEQFQPFPVYPCWHVHSYELFILVQLASRLHLCVRRWHSSISVNKTHTYDT